MGDQASIVLSPDLQLYVEQEAVDEEITPTAWIERMLRARIVNGTQ